MNIYRGIDFYLLLPSLIIFVLGVTILSSIAPGLVLNQVFFGIFALFIFLAVAKIDFTIYQNFWKLFYGLSVFFLVLTFIFGEVTRGSVRWIDFGFFRLQPSEIIKPMVVVFCAKCFLDRNTTIFRFFINSILFMVPVVLILKQPDLGNALVFLAVFLAIFIMSGYRTYLLPIFSLIFVATTPVIWRFLKDYQKERIISFLNPSADPLGIGYNSLQSIIAVGSGGLFGLGLGRGTQSHLLFLPEYHTDFIFASFAEEFGFLGVLLLLALYLLVFFRMIKIISGVGRFGCLAGTGVLAIVFTQCFVNMGMNMGILPITGITLPLMSYGGSSLISTGMLLGIMSNISRNQGFKNALTIR